MATVKPVGVMSWQKSAFAGSCTTIEAARAEHVRSVGIDLHEEHLAEGWARLEGEQSLFAGRGAGARTTGEDGEDGTEVANAR